VDVGVGVAVAVGIAVGFSVFMRGMKTALLVRVMAGEGVAVAIAVVGATSLI
jgi:hypothetical protein